MNYTFIAVNGSLAYYCGAAMWPMVYHGETMPELLHLQTATLLVKCLQYSHCVLTDSVYIGGLLLRHICQLVCNAHAITKIQVSGTGFSCK